MPNRRLVVGLGCWLLASALLAGIAQAQQTVPAPATAAPARASAPSQAAALTRAALGMAIPLDKLPLSVQTRARNLVERPTLRCQGQVQIFNCQPEQYFWLLDHPDVTAGLWRALGVKVTEIQNHRDGHFSWEDENGSKIDWDTVLNTADYRVWLADGRVKPAMLLPAISVHALVAVRHTEGTDGDGQPAIRHQIAMVLQTDNQAVALAARLLGASAPHLAEQFVGQIEMFFGYMAVYLDQHPRHSAALLAEVLRANSPKAPQPPAKYPGLPSKSTARMKDEG